MGIGGSVRQRRCGARDQEGGDRRDDEPGHGPAGTPETGRSIRRHVHQLAAPARRADGRARRAATRRACPRPRCRRASRSRPTSAPVVAVSPRAGDQSRPCRSRRPRSAKRRSSRARRAARRRARTRPGHATSTGDRSRPSRVVEVARASARIVARGGDGSRGTATGNVAGSRRTSRLRRAGPRPRAASRWSTSPSSTAPDTQPGHLPASRERHLPVDRRLAHAAEVTLLRRSRMFQTRPGVAEGTKYQASPRLLRVGARRARTTSRARARRSPAARR